MSLAAVSVPPSGPASNCRTTFSDSAGETSVGTLTEAAQKVPQAKPDLAELNAWPTALTSRMSRRLSHQLGHRSHRPCAAATQARQERWAHPRQAAICPWSHAPLYCRRSTVTRPEPRRSRPQTHLVELGGAAMNTGQRLTVCAVIATLGLPGSGPRRKYRSGPRPVWRSNREPNGRAGPADGR